jgi:hypothetical protein
VVRQGDWRGTVTRFVVGAPAAYLCGEMLSRAVPSGFIEPCLPSPAERPPSGPNWIHEIKHDGFPLMARLAEVRATDAYPIG